MDQTATEDHIIEVRDNTPREDRAKFREVFLYLVNKLKDRTDVGEMSMQKMLYFIDFDHYELHEEQLMGLRYIRNEHGPTARMFKKWTDEMADDGLIKIVKPDQQYGPKTRYLPAGDARPNLNEDEARHIDQVLERLQRRARGLRGKQLEELSHKDIPWIGAKPKADLEYEGVFYRTDATSVRVYDEDEDD